ncbi:hypothetical protein CIPAW_16G044700 [Carya illinoinensis]|uniref:Uncharacterized protein n=1 Tax=Carya illinoinensis TaxID=32201 RepID=A0A8T1N6M0_CARIL|nr:hypothetical protein CIPAW_16G044700 [Carya illinoinensis]
MSKTAKQNQSRAPSLQAAAVVPTAPSTLESATEPSSVSTTLTAVDIEALTHQVLSRIYTADGSYLSVSQFGSISSPTLSIDNTYLVPKLSLNLLSVGQLCELCLKLTFPNADVDVQNPQTGQLIGTYRKIGCLFELASL